MLITFIIFTIIFAVSVVVMAYGKAYSFTSKGEMLWMIGIVFSFVSGFGWLMSGIFALIEYQNKIAL